ncbi:MAG: 2-(1,2-epoxy-1,2-dihydrophenyl)acetyl-CoA isomerase PaaG [Stellaceae bacterium]
MAWKTVLFEIADGVGTLTLNRPDKLNAFNDQLHLDIADVINQVENDKNIRALVITGAGRGFCSGADLTQRIAPGSGAGDALDQHYHPRLRRLKALAKPVIAAVNGPAAGAGMSLALACDIVIAAESAVFIQAFTRIGLVPDAGSTYFLPRLVGTARAKALTLLAEPLSARDAAAWGLILKAVPDAQLMEEAMAMARKLAAGPTFALGLTKQAIDQSLGNDLDTQLSLERDFQKAASRSADFREGVTAFLEKRAARFTGE